MFPHHRNRPATHPAAPARPTGPAANLWRPEKFAATRTTDDTAPDPAAADYDRPIPYYTRADAVADGLLIEVPRRLCEAFRLPAQTLVTDQLWADAIATAAFPKPPAPTTRPPWPGDGLPDEVRGRLVDLLWLTRAYRETDPGRSLATTFVLWRVPARLAPSAGGDQADPIRVTCTIHAGDHGETVATLAHAHTDTAGTFHLDGDPTRQWPAVRFDPDGPDGYARPVVTVETLAAMLTAAAGTPRPTHRRSRPSGPTTDGFRSPPAGTTAPSNPLTGSAGSTRSARSAGPCAAAPPTRPPADPEFTGGRTGKRGPPATRPPVSARTPPPSP